ncbi:MAG: 30S ribosomal protein S27ae [Nanoarchaeota archaeon]
MVKRKVKNKKPSQRWKKYKLQSGKLIRERTCPKCGPGIFLGVHKDRYYCGNCHYVEIIKK